MEESDMSYSGIVRLAAMLKKFCSILWIRLWERKPPLCRAYEYWCPPQASPIQSKGPQYPPEKRRLEDKYVKQLWHIELWIEMPSAYSQAGPFLVLMKNWRKQFHITTGIYPANSDTVKEAWPKPHLEAEINDFEGRWFFASIDLVREYQKVRFNGSSLGKCRIVT